MKIKIHISSQKILLLVLPIIISSVILFLFKENILSFIENTSYKRLIKSKISFSLPSIHSIDKKPIDKKQWIYVMFDAFTLVPFKENVNKGNIPIPKKKFVIPKIDKKKQPPPKYSINMIYVGVNKKFVVLNNKLLTEGDFISDKEYVVLIDKEGVLLDGDWGKRWIRIK